MAQHAPKDFMATLIPHHFLSTPGLWTGLALAAVFLAAAVRLRRYARTDLSRMINWIHLLA